MNISWTGLLQVAGKNALSSFVINHLRLEENVLGFLQSNPTLAPFATGATYVVMNDAVQAATDGSLQNTLIGALRLVDAADAAAYNGIVLTIFQRLGLLQQLYNALVPLNIAQMPSNTFASVVEGVVITIINILRMYLPTIDPKMQYVTNPIRIFVPA